MKKYSKNTLEKIRYNQSRIDIANENKEYKSIMNSLTIKLGVSFLIDSYYTEMLYPTKPILLVTLTRKHLRKK